MADVYLVTNSTGASDVRLTTATAETASTSGGQSRPIRSASQPRQIQRFIRYQWTLLVAITGHTSTPTRVTPPAPTATGTLHTTATTTAPATQTSGHLRMRTRVTRLPVHARARPEQPPAHVDDDLLLILDLL